MKTYLSFLILFLFTALSTHSQTLTGISPSQGTAGTTVTAILTGQNTFFMSSSPQGIQQFNLNKGFCRFVSGTNFVTLNDDSVQVDIPIPAGFVNDVYNVSVYTGAGQTLMLPAAFTVTGGVDQSIQGFSPSIANEGTTINAQITGQNLQTISGMPGFNITLNRNSRVIPAMNVTVISPGQINADFYIPAFYDTGYYECRITVVNNCFNMGNALHVTGAFPKQLVSITPSTVDAGSTLSALITGQNTFFMSASPQGIQSIKLENEHCNIYNGTSISVTDDEHLNVDFVFPADASNGQYDLTVTLNANPQFILPLAVTVNNGVSREVNSITPGSASAGSTVSTTIDGVGLADIISQAPVTIELISAAGFVIESTTYSMAGQQLMADFDVPPFADNGFYRLEITSGTGCYKINNAVQVSGGTPPAILSINPSQGLRGQTLTALMTGRYTFFMPGTQSGGISSVLFSHATTGSSFSVLPPAISYIDSEHVDLTITIPANRPAGYYNVAVNRVSNPTLHLNPGFQVTGTVLSGKVYLDVDSNGIFNTGDVYLPNQRVNAQPDAVTTFTNQNGEYAIGVEPGLDTIRVIPDSGWVHTSATSYILTVGANDTSGFDFGVRPLNDEFEVLLEQTAGFPRCNTNVYYNTTFKNNSTNVIDATIWWLPDTSLTVVSSTPPPSMISGDTLFWTVSNLLVQTSFVVQSVVQMPGAFMVVRSYSCAEATYNGNVVATSCDSVRQTVVCSFDPNDKAAEPEGMFAQHYVLGADYITYLVRFQNTGNDTAFTVSIFDTIDASLDLSTFELVSNSHPVVVYINDRVVEFRFDNILLADSFVNEPLSHGFVKFRIKPTSGWLDGTVIENTASIHFDLNAPVITNTVMNTVVTQIPVSIRELTSGAKQLILYPNPTDGTFNFELPEQQFIDGTVLVLDQTGRVVRRITIHSHRGEINLGSYPAGIYTVVVMNNEGIARGKVVVY